MYQAGRILSLRAASHVRKRQLLGDITILNTQNKLINNLKNKHNGYTRHK